MSRILSAFALCLPLWMAGCSPSYVPAPVVNLETPEAEEEKKPAPEPKVEAPPAPPPIPDEPRPEFYTVRSGDTLAAIALNFGMSHREIALWNGMANPDLVQVGQRLRLSPPNSQPVATPVVGEKEPGLIESGASGAKTTGLVSAKAPALSAAPSAENGTVLHPRTTRAGNAVATTGAGGNAEVGVGVGGSGSVKTGPLAESFAYSAAKLRALRTAWDARQNPEEVVVVSPSPQTNAAAPDAGGAGRADSPQSIRRAFGVEWSWPARGNLLSGFSESSRGWDIGGKAGDPIYAAADGRVIYAGSGIKGFGRLVIVKHTNDYLSAYAHNRRILMKEGARVRRGDLIAEMGDTGAERIKLHFEIRKAGKPTDPSAFLPERSR